MGFLRKLLNSAQYSLVGQLNVDEKEGLSRAIRLILKRRKLLSWVLLTGFAAAVFEGSSIGILGVAVSILMNEAGQISVGILPGSLGSRLDRLIEITSPGNVFLWMIAVAVVSQVLKSFLLFVSQATQIYLSTDMKRKIQREVTDQIMSMSYPQVSSYPAGTMAGVIDQAACVQDVVDMVSNTARAILMLVAYVIVLLMLSSIMAVGTIAVIAILWIALNRAVRTIKDFSVRATKAKLKVFRWTVEYLNAPRLLRVINATTAAGKRINDARDIDLIAERNSSMIDAMIKPTMEAITVIGTGVFLIVGYLLAGESAIEAVPKLFVFVLVFYRMKPQIQAFNDLRVKLARILPRLEVVNNFLRKQGKEFLRVDGKTFSGLKKEINFSDLSFSYGELEATVLDGISFTIPKGSTIALVGASGAGKSTIADLLLALYRPERGTIFVDGVNLNELSLLDWHNHIGVVEQNIVLLNTTIYENIRFGRPDATLDDVEKAARAAYAHEFIKELGDGYETVIGDRGYRISGGQQQRLALARALLCNPEILVLDEATSALDTISERLIHRALEEMHNQRTIFVIAHRLSTIANADQILVLENGKIIEKGTRDELLTKAGRFSKYWNIQTNNSN
jgi:ATP-binding cassette subfamily B protein/subfamily B ATP-binding cassette protein MsbA